MGYTTFSGGLGLIVMPWGDTFEARTDTTATINAVGESCAMIGRISLSTGVGTSKTISSAGGKIYFKEGVSGTTWASGSTNLRVGIQDVSAVTGIEDGVYDTYDDLVPGIDTLSNNIIRDVTLSSGTKTITHGDIIAVVIEMTARGGTDTVSPAILNVDTNFPYVTIDTGAGPVKNINAPIIALTFDDGTIGYFGSAYMPGIGAAVSFGSTSSPDEYGIIFQLPFKCKINGLCARFQDIDSGDDGVLALISAPLTSPADMTTVSVDSAYSAQAVSTGIANSIHAITETELAANTDYAITYRPSTSAVRSIYQYTLAHADHRKASIFGTNLRGGTRTDLGAFTASTTVIPEVGFRISQIDAGTGSAASSAYVG